MGNRFKKLLLVGGVAILLPWGVYGKEHSTKKGSSTSTQQESQLDKEVMEAYYRSYNYEKMGDYRDAIRALLPIYHKFPRSYTLNLRLGWLTYLNRKYGNSIQFYRKALLAMPSSLEPRLGLMRVYLALGNIDEALAQGLVILKRDYYNYYGNLYYVTGLERKGLYKNEIDLCYKMLALYPTSVPFLTHLGIALFKIGKREKAKKVFKGVLILDPNNIIAREYLNK
jgi:tetratricopeptide (TPR) repeat protein